MKPFTSENLMCIILESGDVLHIYIYNKIREIHCSLMLKSMFLLDILLVTKISCFITLLLTKLKYPKKQTLIRDIFPIYQNQNRTIYLHPHFLYLYILLISWYLYLNLPAQYYCLLIHHLFQIIITSLNQLLR